MFEGIWTSDLDNVMEDNNMLYKEPVSPVNPFQGGQ